MTGRAPTCLGRFKTRNWYGIVGLFLFLYQNKGAVNADAHPDFPGGPAGPDHQIFITHTMTVGMSFPVIPGVVSCTYVLNPGAAFGLLEYQRVFFVVITLLAAGAVFYFRDHIHREGPKARLGTGLFLGGAWGT